MTQPSKPRGPLGALIERYKDEHGFEWSDVYAAAGVPKTTLEQWISGRTREPQLRAMLRIRRFLRIPVEEFEREALAPDEESGTARSPTAEAVSHALPESPRVPRRGTRSTRR